MAAALLLLIVTSPVSAAVWYVNDTSTVGDSFTFIVGNNVNSGTTPDSPKRTISAALALVAPGDSVFVDAGLFTETVIINANGIALIGKDSLSTIIDPPGAKTVLGLNGIYADTQTGLVIRGFGVTGARDGINLRNVDSSVIEDDSVTVCGASGIVLQDGSDGNLVRNNISRSHPGSGIYVYRSSGNTFASNTSRDNGERGILFYDTANNNRAVNNQTSNNGNFGFYVLNSSGNVIASNQIDSNTKYQIQVEGASSSNTIAKNNFGVSPYNPESFVFATGTLALQRNWWGSVDTNRVKNRIWGPSRGTIEHIPFRLGLVDTSPGADTVAPRAPDTVVVTTLSQNALRVQWAPVTLDEETDPYATNLAGFRIWRSPTAETTLWIAVGVTGAATNFFDDTVGLAASTTYHYRVTSFDNASPFPNQSWWSESIASAMTTIDTTGPNIWYVNDTSIAGDSFTSAIGNDANDGLSPATPKRTVIAAMALVSVGDTVFVDAGTFGESVLIATNSVCLIGKDSSSTIVDPAGTSTTGETAIRVSGASGVLVRNLRAQGARAGIEFRNVAVGRIEAVSVGGVGQQGIVLRNGSTGNQVSGCSVTGVPLYYGYWLVNNADGNTLTENTSQGNGHGFYFESGSDSNTVSRNRSFQNANHGISVSSSHYNVICGHSVVGNGQEGVSLSGTATGNVFDDNQFDSCGRYIASINNAVSGTVFTKNSFNINAAHPDSAIEQLTGNAVSMLRNWWGTTDTVALYRRIAGSGRPLVGYTPFRLGAADTRLELDSVAPRAPDTVAATGISSSANRVSWSPVTLDEEADPYATNLAGYRIYRSATVDTSLWVQVGAVGASALYWDNTGCSPSQTWFYRVTSVDSWTPYENQSFYSDSIASATTDAIDTLVANVWYVNDTATTGDSFTSAIGNNANNGITPATPKRNIQTVMGLVTPGDTVLVDAGLYTETVVIGVNNIALIGKDSLSTIIDPPGPKTTLKLYGIYADTQTGLVIRGFGITGCHDGVLLLTVDSSIVEDDSTTNTGASGIAVTGGSTGNLVRRNFSRWNPGSGIYVQLSSSNTIASNDASYNGERGILLYDTCQNNRVINNRTTSNGQYGFLVINSTGNYIAMNTVDSNGLYSISVDGASNGNTLAKNNISGPAAHPDSLLFTTSVTTAIRNWWGTTDTIALYRGIAGSGRASVHRSPFRLGPVDTAPGADTVAPRSPDTVAATSIDSRSIRVSWKASYVDEEASSFAVGVTGYRIYRARTADTSYWHRIGQVEAGTLSFLDSGLLAESGYFYTVTAFDNHTPYENEGFYSDSITGDTTRAAQPFVIPSALLNFETRVTTFTLRWDTFLSNTPLTYRVRIATDNGFTVIALDTAGLSNTSVTVTLPANSRYTWRVIAEVGSFSHATPPAYFTIDTMPPSVPLLVSPADSASVTSLLVNYVWQPSTDSPPANAGLYAAIGPKIASYRLAVSRNSAFTDTVIDQSVTDTSATPGYTYTNGQTYYWRVRAVDYAGNASAWSANRAFTKTQPADTTPPVSALDLEARALDTGSILVTWKASPSLSMTGGYYRLQWDSGSGGSPSTLIETRAHAAGGTYSHLTGLLTNGVTYTFQVIAVSAAGVSDGGLAIARATCRYTSLSLPALRFIRPQSDKKVNRGSAVQVEVGPIDHGDANLVNLGRVRFQYRRSGFAGWTDMPVGTNGKSSNPEVYRGSGNIGIHWDASTLPPDTYELRAIPIHVNGLEQELGAVSVNVTLTTNASDAGESTALSSDGKTVSHDEKLHGNVSETITTSLPTNEEARVALDSSAIPLDANGQAPKLQLILAETFPQDAGLPDSITNAGPVLSVHFSTNEQPKNEVTVEITLPPLDPRGRALVGRRKIPLSQLKCFRHNGTSWVELSNFEIDTNAGVIRIRTSNFSLFRAAAPESSLIPALTAPTPETPSATYRTRSTSVPFRWGSSLDEDTITVRYRVQVSTSPQFGALALDTTNIVETGATVALGANTTYYWRVISSNGQGETQPSSQTHVVIVDTAPPVVGAAQYPADTFPAIAARNATQVRWAAASDSDYVDSYRLQVWRGDTAGGPIVDSALTSASLSTTFGALTPDTYYWRLWAADGVQNQSSTGYKLFRVYKTGDANADGRLNPDDYFSYGRRYGGAGTNLPLGDLDQDGSVDRDDLLILLQENPE